MVNSIQELDNLQYEPEQAKGLMYTQRMSSGYELGWYYVGWQENRWIKATWNPQGERVRFEAVMNSEVPLPVWASLEEFAQLEIKDLVRRGRTLPQLKDLRLVRAKARRAMGLI